MNILFVCAGNAVRSQMAEGLARKMDTEGVNVSSAGIHASGVHLRAIESMLRIGIDISDHGSRRLDDELIGWADVIVTLADSIKSYCTCFPPELSHFHWSIPNPDAMFDPNLTIEGAYDIVRDDIKKRIENLIMELLKEN